MNSFSASRVMNVLLVATLLQVSPLGAAAALEVPLSEPSGAKVLAWTESSLVRVYPRTPAGTSTTQTVVAPRNGKVSFQLCARNLSTGVTGIECRTVDTRDLKVQVRRVGYVPMDHLTPGTPLEELEGLDYLPGLVPDPLMPEPRGTMGPQETLSFWVTVDVPADIPPGPRELAFRFALPHDKSADLKVTVDVRPFTLNKRKDFPVTHWWRPLSIFRHYKQVPYSDEWFATTRKYVQNMVDHGSNMMFVPALEVRRELFTTPSQMLLIKRDGEKYSFDYTHVRRFVKMARECGMEYFEWPHLFIYWGVKNPMVVYEEVNGKYVPLWPVDSDCFSPMYRNFLKQYLDALHAFLQEEKLLEISYFHVSDEPSGDEHFERYKRARQMLKELAPWMPVMDAISELRYGQSGVCENPVPIEQAAIHYVKAGLPHWVYYCCAPTGGYLNRFMDTPLSKIRMTGFVFYKMNPKGFLHWGYNYYDVIEKDQGLDPFKQGDSAAWPMIPYGDPFVVYPGPDGPIDSVRWEIFAEGLQDYAMLQTAGLKHDDPLLAPITDYHLFPKNEQWVRKAVLDVLERKAQP